MVPWQRSALVFTLLAVLTACSDQATGVPTAGESTPQPTSAGPFSSTPERSTNAAGASTIAKSPIANISPCSLLSPAEVTELQAGPSKEERLNKGRACSFYEAEGFTIGVVIFDELGLGDLVSRDTPKEVTIGKHKALQSVGGIDTCAISIEVTKTSRVDTQGTAGRDQKKSCELALRLARLVEPKLPPS
jgi:hypothetical protein